MAVLVTILEMNERQGLEGERGNPRRRFPSVDEAQVLSLFVEMRSKIVITKGLNLHLRSFKMVILSSYVALTLLIKDFF